MKKLDDSNLKLAIQKDGRLTEETVSLLRSIDLGFENYKQRLFSTCRNFPLEILYVRDDDIPYYVSSGIADLGIVGQNIVFESKLKVKKLLNLRFGFCSLVVAVPEEAKINKIEDLKNKKIATSYPNSTRDYFKKRNIPVNIVKISGSVEIAPSLEMASAIVDLVATGSTLALNGLKIIEKISTSEAVLIANPKIKKGADRGLLIQKITSRLKTSLSAKNYKYLIMNIPSESLPKIKKLIPSLKMQHLDKIDKNEVITVQAAIKEEVLWNTIDQAKNLGASKLFVLPIEKIIN